MPYDYQTSVSSYDRLFDRAFDEDFNLSIRFTPDGLSFSVYSPEHERYVGFEVLMFHGIDNQIGEGLIDSKYISTIRQLLNEHPVLTRKFNSVCAIFYSYFFTLIPNPLFNERLSENYLKFVHNIGENNAIRVQNLNAADVRLVYSIPVELISAVEAHFPEVIAVHDMGALLNTLIPAFKRAEQPEQLFAVIENSTTGIILLRAGMPVFCNMFHCRTNEDTVYFLMYVIEQLGLNPEKIPLHLMGNISENDGLFALISRYIKNAALLKNSGVPRAGYATISAEYHRYINLLNPAICG